MVIVDDEGVPVAQRVVPVRMRVRLRPFPARVSVLVTLIVDMQVLVTVGLVDMLDLDRIPGWPEPCRHRRRGHRQDTQHREADAEPRLGAQPSGQGVRDQPAGVAQGKLRREHGWAVLGMGGPPQRAARGRQHGGVRHPQDEPDWEEPWQRDGEAVAQESGHHQQPGGQDGGAGDHDGAIGSAFEQPRQGQRHRHRSGPVGSENDGDVRVRAAQHAADEDDGVDDDHGFSGGDGAVEGQEAAQPRRLQVQANAARRPAVDATAPLDRLRAGDGAGGGDFRACIRSPGCHGAFHAREGGDARD